MYRKLLYGLSLMVLLTSVASAETPILCTPGLMFKWDFAPNEHLVKFHIYVRSDEGSYDEGHPTKVVPAVPELITQVPCETLIITGDGHYYAAIAAVDKNQKESALSNEVSFQWGVATKMEPPASSEPLPSEPLPSFLSPVPPPLTISTPPITWPAQTGGGLLSETCQWTGGCP